MQRRPFLSLATAGFAFGQQTAQGADDDVSPDPKLRIFLDPESPSKSYGVFDADHKKSTKEIRIPVGMGRNGTTPAGKAFRGGSSLLGKFRINAVLSAKRFEMEESLVRESGKTRTWLREHLFRNMSSIDFDGDGKGGEYGTAFIGLSPIDSKASQPFHFGNYKGTFRWYSYAIHGTQEQSRIGKCATGGCINVGTADLEILLKNIKIGDLVSIKNR